MTDSQFLVSGATGESGRLKRQGTPACFTRAAGRNDKVNVPCALEVI